jgi:hypothetical protein
MQAEKALKEVVAANAARGPADCGTEALLALVWEDLKLVLARPHLLNLQPALEKTAAALNYAASFPCAHNPGPDPQAFPPFAPRELQARPGNFAAERYPYEDENQIAATTTLAPPRSKAPWFAPDQRGVEPTAGLMDRTRDAGGFLTQAVGTLGAQDVAMSASLRMNQALSGAQLQQRYAERKLAEAQELRIGQLYSTAAQARASGLVRDASTQHGLPLVSFQDVQTQLAAALRQTLAPALLGKPANARSGDSAQLNTQARAKNAAKAAHGPSPKKAPPPPPSPPPLMTPDECLLGLGLDDASGAESLEKDSTRGEGEAEPDPDPARPTSAAYRYRLVTPQKDVFPETGQYYLLRDDTHGNAAADNAGRSGKGEASAGGRDESPWPADPRDALNSAQAARGGEDDDPRNSSVARDAEGAPYMCRVEGRGGGPLHFPRELQLPRDPVSGKPLPLSPSDLLPEPAPPLKTILSFSRRADPFAPAADHRPAHQRVVTQGSRQSLRVAAHAAATCASPRVAGPSPTAPLYVFDPHAHSHVPRGRARPSSAAACRVVPNRRSYGGGRAGAPPLEPSPPPTPAVADSVDSLTGPEHAKWPAGEGHLNAREFGVGRRPASVRPREQPDKDVVMQRAEGDGGGGASAARATNRLPHAGGSALAAAHAHGRSFGVVESISRNTAG